MILDSSPGFLSVDLFRFKQVCKKSVSLRLIDKNIRVFTKGRNLHACKKKKAKIVYFSFANKEIIELNWNVMMWYEFLQIYV